MKRFDKKTERRSIQDNNVLRLRTLGSLYDVKLHPVAFFKRAIAFLANNSTVMDKYISPMVAFNITISFSAIKPLDNAGFLVVHAFGFLIKGGYGENIS